MYFSIIITVFNKEDTIQSTVLSVLNQHFRNFELIIIEDSSQDDSLEIIHKLQESNSNIKLIVNHENLGVSVSRNLGLENATGKFIILLDGDDILIDNSILDKLYFITENVNSDFFIMNRIARNDKLVINIQKVRQHIEKTNIEQVYNIRDIESFLINLNFPIGGSCSVLFKKNTIRFYDIREAFEDWLFNMMQIEFYEGKFYIDFPVARIRKSKYSLSNQLSQTKIINKPYFYNYLHNNKQYNLSSHFIYLWLPSQINTNFFENLQINEILKTILTVYKFDKRYLKFVFEVILRYIKVSIKYFLTNK